MFQFANPTYLYLLAALVVFALLHYWALYQRQGRLARYGDPAMVNRLIKDYSLLRTELKFWLLQLALACFILALARPQNGTNEAEQERYGIEAIVALDISNSMMAQDVHPTRLDKSKRMITNMMRQMTNDQIGLVLFAGSAFTQVPITNDFTTAQMSLEQVSPSLISLQGTDIARAIQLAQESFTQREGVNRAILILTDGEDNEGGAVEAARAAAEKGIAVYVLGVGSPQGAKVPLPEVEGQYIIDGEGNPVVSKLNEDMCRQIAQAGKGAYIYVDNSSTAQEALNQYIDRLSKAKLGSVKYAEYNEKYQLFLLIGLLLLLLDVCILARQNHYFQKISLFTPRSGRSGGRGLAICFLLLAAGLTSCTQTTYRDHVRRGNRDYEAFTDTLQEKHDSTLLSDACTEYERAISRDSLQPIAHYNLGNAYLLSGQDSAAFTHYLKADSLQSDYQSQARIHRNIGVLLQSSSLNATSDSVKNALLNGAIANYKASLRYDPHNDETRYNLALCLWQVKRDNQGGGGEQNQQDQKEGEQDKQQGQNDPQQKPDQQGQQNQQQQQQEQQQQQQQQREASEQMIEAAKQRERETQQRMQLYQQRQRDEQQQGQSRRLQKNW